MTDITANAADDLLSLARLVETRDNAADQLLDRTLALMSEDAGSNPDDQAEYLWMIDNRLADMAARIKVARNAAQTALLRNVATHGAIRLGDNAYKAAPDAGWEIDDRDSLIDYLAGLGTHALAEAFRLDASNLRVTALRALAAADYRARYPEEDDEENVSAHVDAVFDTFVSRQPRGDGGWRLDTVYPGKAVWAQRLDHRQRDLRRRRLPPKGYVDADEKENDDAEMD